MKQHCNKEALFKEYYHLVPATVHKMYSQQFLKRHGLAKEDLIQVGAIGLMKAIDSYTEGKSQLQTYMINYIKWEVSIMAREYSMFVKNKRTFDLVQGVSLNDTVQSEGEEVELHELVDSTHSLGSDPYEEESIKMEVELLLEELKETVPPHVYEIILAKSQGKETADIAQERGVTVQAVSKALRKYQDDIYKALSN